MTVAIQTKIHKTVMKRQTISIGRTVLREFLHAQGIEVPPDATISFWVPGGGDWSNMAIDLDDEDQVVSVTWTTTEEE